MASLDLATPFGLACKSTSPPVWSKGGAKKTALDYRFRGNLLHW